MSDFQLSLNKCPICDGVDFSLRYRVDEYRYFSCRHCGLVFLGNKLSVDDIFHLYNEQAYLSKSYKYGRVDEASLNYFDNQKRIRIHAQDNLCDIRQILPNVSRGERPRLLDVGSAAGFFLDVARTNGFDVRGVEISKEGQDRARNDFGLEIIADDLSAVGSEYFGFFDIITMFDVLEHLPDPGSALAKANELLGPGGVLVIELPNISTIDRFRSDILLSILQPPHHMFMYSARNIKKLLARHGFSVLHEKYYPSEIIASVFFRIFSILGIKKAVKENLATAKSSASEISTDSMQKTSLLLRGRNLIKDLFPGSKMRLIFLKDNS